MSNNLKPYENLKYFALALDPIHVGTGGYRLGRVDLSIAREPGTNVPKIPGTSLSGVCRTYATMQAPKKWPQCAGQGQPNKKKRIEGHCGKPDCPICVTFGFSKGEKSSFQGLAQFSDARLVFFPIHSLAGPVWVTCSQILADWAVKENVPKENEPVDGEVFVAEGIKIKGRLNLGWLMLEAKLGLELKAEQFDEKLMESLKNPSMEEVLKRTVLVSNKLFGQIVNDNLEVRTSVSIDPATGAAAEGALFTYEALPRSSVLAFEVVVSDPRFYCIDGKIPFTEKACSEMKPGEKLSNDKHPDGKQRVREAVESGLNLFEALGVGGMNTRGMGRMKVFGLSDGGGK